MSKQPTTKKKTPATKNVRRRRAPRGRDLSHIVAPLRPFAVPIDSLKVDPENARLHTEANVKTIAASLRQFGQDEVLVYRPGGIVVIGNGRLMAARELSADDKRFEYLAAYELDEDQQTSVCRAIAHNRTAETSAWDKNVLRALVKPLRETAEAKAMGWSDAELKRLLDDIEAPPQSPKTTKQIKFTLDIATCDALVAHLKTFADKRDEAIAIWLAQSTGKAARK